MGMLTAIAGLVAGSTLALAAAAEPSKFSIDDLVRVASLTDLDLSPDGEYVVYSVSEPELQVRRAALRPLARALGRQRQAPAHAHGGRR